MLLGMLLGNVLGMNLESLRINFIQFRGYSNLVTVTVGGWSSSSSSVEDGVLVLAADGRFSDLVLTLLAFVTVFFFFFCDFDCDGQLLVVNI